MSKKETEKRTYNIESRTDEGDGRKVSGYAAIYRSTSNELWGFEEIIEAGAFDNADLSDVRALFNHDPNQILARTSSGTMKLESDETGLRYEFEMPDTTLGRDLLVMMKRGDISQSSLAFTIKEDEWEEREGALPLRHIRQIDRVYDVSPVTYPAYEKTSVTARSFQVFQDEKAQAAANDDIELETEIFILNNEQ
jgi:uncharacterized protein